MSDAFHLQIISPAKIVVDAHVISTQIPGFEGDFGVLPGHCPFFSMLRPGVIDVVLSDGVHRRFFAATGYADVTPTSCIVISDHVQDLTDISMAEADEALAAARAALAQATDDGARADAEKLVQSAQILAAAIRD